MVPPSPSKKKLHCFEMPDDLNWANQKRTHGHVRHAPANRPPELDQPQTIHESGSKSTEAKEKHNITCSQDKNKRTQVEGNKGSKASTSTVPAKQEKSYCPTRLSIPLTREEIEEDFYGMTGKKLPRKIMKRDKSVQRDLDDVFPGLSLEGESAESLLKKYT